MIVRQPIVAGMFYQSDTGRCRQEAAELFRAASAGLDAGLMAELPDRIVGGIVPHAGWAFSGEPAARVLEAVARTRNVASFVLFGAAHSHRCRQACLFDRGRWQTPLGDVEVDERLARLIAEASELIVPSPAAHTDEHSIEVQLPLLRHRLPHAKIVPIIVPPIEQAQAVGQAVASAIAQTGQDVMVIGSTDLTHYGPRYGLVSHGLGPAAAQWAKQVNDSGVIDAVVRLDAEKVVPETQARLSACGGGAVAATLAAAKALGATRGVVLEHVSSYEIMVERFGQQSDDSVSYLSAVLG